MEEKSQKPHQALCPQMLCAEEALDVLNFATKTSIYGVGPWEQTILFHRLQKCVREKKVKKFTLAKQRRPKESDESSKSVNFLVANNYCFFP